VWFAEPNKMQAEINEIDWTHSKLRVIQSERMKSKTQFRFVAVTSPYPAQGALRTSSSVFMSTCSKRMLTAITMQINRISKKAETG
jgi:hypothetical protein